MEVAGLKVRQAAVPTTLLLIATARQGSDGKRWLGRQLKVFSAPH